MSRQREKKKGHIGSVPVQEWVQVRVAEEAKENGEDALGVARHVVRIGAHLLAARERPLVRVQERERELG